MVYKFYLKFVYLVYLLYLFIYLFIYLLHLYFSVSAGADPGGGGVPPPFGKFLNLSGKNNSILLLDPFEKILDLPLQ